jgi:thiamine biosynthesis lipoprotein
MSAAETVETFACFGSSCSVLVTGRGDGRSARQAVDHVRRSLLEWHGRFSRFLPGSELSLLNNDPRPTLQVSPLMARFASAVTLAGSTTGGLVDATLLEHIEAAGYSGELARPLTLARALRLAPPRRPARPATAPGFSKLHVDAGGRAITRPPGLRLDSGGLVKGLFADVLAEDLAGHPRFAVDCAGDLVVGGSERAKRAIHVESPFDGGTLHTFELARTGVATSGIGRRAWIDGDGRPAHHLLDPSTGRPAFTGIVQVTALAPSALTAEIRAKAAILGGPRTARQWLSDGGVIVFDDGSHALIEPPPVVTLSQLSGAAKDPARLARQAG